VVPGRQLGRKLGVPTLNFDWRTELQPACGVYAVRVGSEGGRTRHRAVANFGMRPTLGVDHAAPVLEVHVLGECPWGVGDDLRVEWLDFIRPERKFDSLEALRNQIAKDIDSAKTR
jgi:riboflavin kinase/FMN adenylyltransferase